MISLTLPLTHSGSFRLIHAFFFTLFTASQASSRRPDYCHTTASAATDNCYDRPFWGTWGVTPRLGIGHYLLSHSLRHYYGNPSLLKNSICTITIISQQIYTRCHTYMHSQGPVSFPSNSQHNHSRCQQMTHINDNLLAHLFKYIHTPMHTPVTPTNTHIYIHMYI